MEARAASRGNEAFSCNDIACALGERSIRRKAADCTGGEGRGAIITTGHHIGVPAVIVAAPGNCVIPIRSPGIGTAKEIGPI